MLGWGSAPAKSIVSHISYCTRHLSPHSPIHHCGCALQGGMEACPHLFQRNPSIYLNNCHLNFPDGMCLTQGTPLYEIPASKGELWKCQCSKLSHVPSIVLALCLHASPEDCFCGTSLGHVGYKPTNSYHGNWFHFSLYSMWRTIGVTGHFIPYNLVNLRRVWKRWIGRDAYPM